jgi:hypothetical protein
LMGIFDKTTTVDYWLPIADPGLTNFIFSFAIIASLRQWQTYGRFLWHPFPIVSFRRKKCKKFGK